MTLQESEERVDLLLDECSTCLFFQKCALMEAIEEEPDNDHSILEKFINEKGHCKLKDRVNTLTMTDLREYALTNDWLD